MTSGLMKALPVSLSMLVWRKQRKTGAWYFIPQDELLRFFYRSFIFLSWALQRDIMIISDVLPVMVDDALLTSHPIIVNVSKPAEITSVFDSISYSKVGCENRTQ